MVVVAHVLECFPAWAIAEHLRYGGPMKDKAQSLFDMPESHVLARRTDPENSHLAARAIVADGTLGDQQDFVLDVVRRHPNLTAQELARAGETTRDVTTRRLPELERVGKVERCPSRTCRITGRKAAVWRAK